MKALPRSFTYALGVAMALVLVTSASDPNSAVDEQPANQWPSVDAMADMLTRKDGRSLIENAINPAQAIPEMQFLQSDDETDSNDPAYESESKEVNLAELGSKSSLEKQEALADAHVKEDQASLLLSSDATELQKIKGKMTFMVAKAKDQMAAQKSSDAPLSKEDSQRASDSAKKAGAYAKRLNRQVDKVNVDQSKERFAKKTIKQIELLTSDSDSDSDSDLDNDSDDGYGDGDGDGDGDLDDDDAGDSDGGGVPDVISQQLNKEADKYKAVTDQEAQEVKHAKSKIASLQTTVQTLIEKLTKAKSDFASTTIALVRHKAKRTLTKKMYKKIVAKELHHKKTTAIEATIRKQQESLRLQNLKIANVKEQLQKSNLKKKQLQGDRAEAVADAAGQAYTSKGQGMADSNSAVQVMSDPEGGGTAPSPEMAAAVEAVSQNLNKQDLETELMPQVEALKARLTGHALAQAIDKLVSNTVASKVDSAFSDDPNVSSSVEKAVQRIRTKMANKGGRSGIPTPTQVQEEASLAIEKVSNADKALDDVSSKFAAGTIESRHESRPDSMEREDQLLIDLRKVMGE